jgi:hypothetical protein
VKLEIDATLVKALISYLSKRPWDEAETFMHALAALSAIKEAPAAPVETPAA